ncbi:MAG: hemerythrin domain-containing protein [Oscillospiraceae bacterium]|nr:hemerythrin domain-containing protein [Oscillospiraceae bacterium]MCL2277968.1 hemerythrin domain-containing protein [Oscillospiraceae bacterium]
MVTEEMLWKDSYLLGHALIDEQHKGLFKAADTLMEALKQVDTREDYTYHIRESLAFLKEYALNHFRYEEAYAFSMGINYDAHMKLHGKLLGNVFHHEKKLMGSNFANSDVKEFLGFFITWLIYHIAEEDQILSKGNIAAGITSPVSDTIRWDEVIEKFADRTCDVFKTVTGLSEKDITRQMKHNTRITPDVCYEVAIIGKVEKVIGYIYSKEIALGAFKVMTSMEVDELNELIYSSLQEISNIISSRFSGIITASGIECDIDTPRRVTVEEIPFTNHRFLTHTKLGSMEVILFDK